VPEARGTIEIGGTVNGSTSGNPTLGYTSDTWLFEGNAGQVLRLSIANIRPDSNKFEVYDADGSLVAEGADVTFELAATGTYTVVVLANVPEDDDRATPVNFPGGPYTLKLEEGQ
jgi:hypothetical protein